MDQNKYLSNIEVGKYSGGPGGDYELSLPEGITGEFDTEHPLLKSFIVQAQELGLSQNAFTKLLHQYVEYEASETEAQYESLEQVTAELGEDGDKLLAETWQKLNQVAGPEAAQALDSLVNNAAGIRALNRILTGKEKDMAEAGQRVDRVETSEGTVTRAQLRDMRFQRFPDNHVRKGQEMYGRDDEHTARVDGLYEQMFPGEDLTEV